MADEALQQLAGTQADASGVVVHTIPMEFYGGKNPASTDIPVTPAAPVQPRPAAPAAGPRATPSSGARPAIQKPPQGKAWLVPAIVAGVVIVAAGGFALWWFTLRAQPPVAQVIPPPPVVAITPEPPVLDVATTTPEVATTTPEIVKPTAPLLIPAHTFKDSADSDSDGLTDIEEELWGTNGAAADSDGDTFPDTTEITNLYNPAGVTPERLIDANLVSTYINPEYQYSVYYPSTWIAQSIDDTKKEVLFTSITQEFMQVTVLPFPTDVPFAQWFVKTFPGEQLATYTPFVNKFKVSGVMSSDGLVAVITDGAHVYLLTYNGGTRDEINYRTTFKMMVQSFKTSSVTTPIELLPKTTLHSAPSISSVSPAASVATSTATSTTKTDLTPEEVIFVTTNASANSATNTSTTSTPPAAATITKP